LNPRPFGIEPKSTALDHSATSTFLNILDKLLINANAEHAYLYFDKFKALYNIYIIINYI